MNRLQVDERSFVYICDVGYELALLLYIVLFVVLIVLIKRSFIKHLRLNVVLSMWDLENEKNEMRV